MKTHDPFEDQDPHGGDLYEGLIAETVAGRAAPKKRPTRLPLHDIHVVPGVFQIRDEGTDPERVATISKGLTGTETDERVHVWWSGIRWVLIDGHHRVEAYWLKAKRGEEPFRVPVECHVGISLTEAVGLATAINNRDKARLSEEEVSTGCWRIVLIGKTSIPDTTKITGRSTAQVSRMRKTLKTLIERGFKKEALHRMSWRQAREAMRSVGEQMEWEQEDAQKLGRAMATKINKATGFQGVHNPGAFAWALAYLTDNGSIMDRMAQTEAFHDAHTEALERNGWRYHPDADEEGDEGAE